MTITTLNTFQAGTVASVTPVNQNFETLRVAVNTVEQSVTNNRTYLDNKVSEINSSIVAAKKAVIITGEVFCINSGTFDAYENPNILNISGTTLSFNTPFSATNINGDTVTVSTISDISITGYADGTYNVFVDLNGDIEILKNTVFRQPATPTATINDIWLDISKSPLSAKKYTSNGWENFLKIPIGYFTIEQGAVTKTVTNPYNQNGYFITTTGNFPMPDYTKGINQTDGVEYTAESAGWLYTFFSTSASNYTATITLDGVTHYIASGSFYGSVYGMGGGMVFPVAKGTVYSTSLLSSLIFYPIKSM